jgi:hypothetical protein
LLGITYTEFPKDEQAFAEQGVVEAERQLSDPKKFEVFPIRWTRKSRFVSQVRKGDKIILVIKEHTARHAEEAIRLLRTKKTTSRRGTPVAYLYLERPHRPHTVPWRTFKNRCASMGLKLGLGVESREVTNPIQAQKVRAIVSRTAQTGR